MIHSLFRIGFPNFQRDFFRADAATRKKPVSVETMVRPGCAVMQKEDSEVSKMLSEAKDTPNRVREFLAADRELYADLGQRLRDLRPDLVCTIARGSSDNAADYAAYLIPQITGTVVASIPPSLVTIFNAPLKLAGQFVLSISQGGSSPDIIQSVAYARKSGALTAALVNDTSSPLARTAEVLLAQHAGPEESITATKSVLCTLAAIARLAGEWSCERTLLDSLESLPAVLEEACERGLALDENLLQGMSHVFVLSRGLGFGAAREIALKLKETCGIHGEAFSTAEVRHGPCEIVDRSFLVIALALPGSGDEDVILAARELEQQGARVVLLATGREGVSASLPPINDSRLSPIVALQLLYPWMARASKALGRDPDHPRIIKNKIIKTV